MTPEQGALQEYQALRAEMLNRWDRRTSRLDISWAAISALLAAGVIAKIPELGCLALLMVCAGWQDELRGFENMVRIGSYIKIVLEPQIPGLQWETALSILNPQQMKIPFLKRLVPTLFTTYGVFVIASVVFSIILYLEFPPPSFVRMVLFFSLYSVGILFSIKVIANAINFRDKHRIWDENFLRIADRLKFNPAKSNEIRARKVKNA